MSDECIPFQLIICYYFDIISGIHIQGRNPIFFALIENIYMLYMFVYVYIYMCVCVEWGAQMDFLDVAFLLS